MCCVDVAVDPMTVFPPAPPWDPSPSGAPWPKPRTDEAAFIAPGAIVLGQVWLQAGSSVWYGAVLRGDLEAITVGAHSNIQDGAVLHCDAGEPLVLEEFVTVGHRAVIHSARVGRGCLIGMGAIVLNGVTIGPGSIIGAGAVVTKSVPERSLVLGTPGKIIRDVTLGEAEGLIHHAQAYESLAQAHAGKGRDLGF